MGNARVKEARKLSRRSVRAERRLFLADGPNAVTEALAVSDCVVEVFATPAATERYADLADTAPAWTLVDDRAIAALSDSVTPAGLVALCRFLDLPEPADPRLVAICAEIRDPGNAGTVIRCADAAGADGVVLAGDSVDPYNPKTVRATAGSLFHLPVSHTRDPYAPVRAAQDAGLQVLAADGAGELDLHDADDLLSAPTAWLFGNEAHGLPVELAAAADHRVRIPIHGRAESLNLSTAAALCLFESARAQRR
ncbi:MAG TPA: RNA methyltransferase [Nocardioides sp.]|nr:RNA methyltransferase [Nocardioides sp.]